MALTGLQYQSMRLKFRGLLSSPEWFVSEAELDSFMFQLTIDSTGAAALPATIQLACNITCAQYLTAPAYSPSASDVTAFFAQASGVPVGTYALTPGRYLQLQNQFTGALSVAGARTISNMLSYVSLTPFFGDFTTLVSGPSAAFFPYQSITYGGTMLASGTSPPVVTITTPPTTKTAMRIECTAGGSTWTGRVSFDSPVAGGGTFPQTFSSASSPITLNNGAVITIAAGAANTDNVWKATASALGDITGNGNPATQATASIQPVITPGYNGHIGVQFDGVDDMLASAVNLLPIVNAPSYMLAFVKFPTWANFHTLTGANAGAGIITRAQGPTASPNISAGFSSGLFSGTLPIGTLGMVEDCQNGAPSDFIKCGAGSDVSGVAAPNFGGANGRVIGCDGNGAAGQNFANVELLGIMFCPVRPSDAQRATIRSSALAYFGGSLAA